MHKAWSKAREASFSAAASGSVAWQPRFKASCCFQLLHRNQCRRGPGAHPSHLARRSRVQPRNRAVTTLLKAALFSSPERAPSRAPSSTSPRYKLPALRTQPVLETFHKARSFDTAKNPSWRRRTTNTEDTENKPKPLSFSFGSDSGRGFRTTRTTTVTTRTSITSCTTSSATPLQEQPQEPQATVTTTSSSDTVRGWLGIGPLRLCGVRHRG